MPAFICSTCGTQYPPGDAPPAQCPVCEDERQFIPPEGQSWTTLERLRVAHHNGFRQYEPGLIGIGTTPKFAIGQRALLLCTPEGNILWDCISLIDDATVTVIKGLGGLRAIGAALFSLGIPKDTVLKYEVALKADKFLLVVHGTADEVARARDILRNTKPAEIDMHTATPVPA